MKVADTELWDFKPKLIDDDTEILCPKCSTWSLLEGWTEGEVECEDCGDHAAMICPHCEARHDHVWAKPFATRDKEPTK
jgi:Zn finger protein HypA/HybF involved in hydrogenase expression